jgi:hypothetical protein
MVEKLQSSIGPRRNLSPAAQQDAKRLQQELTQETKPSCNPLMTRIHEQRNKRWCLHRSFIEDVVILLKPHDPTSQGDEAIKTFPSHFIHPLAL